MFDALTPELLALDAPLLHAWHASRAAAQEAPSFCVPGHKQSTALIGDIVSGDLALWGGVSPVKTAHHDIAAAEARAAALWGADWCRFSVGGSTHGNQALALAVGRPGDTVIVGRTLHRSLLLGLVFAGLHPVWVTPRPDSLLGLPGAVAPEDIATALASHPEAVAVFIGDPSYVGTRSDLPAIASISHAAGVPLVVDAAWAAHHGFHPAMPRHALEAGADALVTSAHKLLLALNQGAIVMARTTASGGLLDPGRLQRAFDATNTTSPSGAILASIDASRALLAHRGEELSQRLLDVVADAQDRLSEVPGVLVLRDDPGGLRVDPTKLVLNIAGTGALGPVIEADLVAAGMPLEMADHDLLVPIISFADDDNSVKRLVDALIVAFTRHATTPRPITLAPAWSLTPELVIDPREAFFAEHETLPADEAVGRISAELIAPYPPGVPVLAPGERITAEGLAVLRAVQRDGGRIAYAHDPSVKTLQVVAQAE